MPTGWMRGWLAAMVVALFSSGAVAQPVPGAGLNLPDADYISWLNRWDVRRARNLIVRDPAAAEAAFRKMMATGDPWAVGTLGYILTLDPADTARWDEGMRLLEDAAERGNLIALDSLGLIYFTGHGVAQDHAKAAGLFRAAAEGGFGNSMRNLGIMIYFGMGTEPDPERSVMWHTLSAAVIGPQAGPDGYPLFWGAFHSGLEVLFELDAVETLEELAIAEEARDRFDALGRQAYEGQEQRRAVEQWAGMFYCAQGPTGALLSIDLVGSERGDALDGLLYFFAMPENPDVPDGCVAGKIEGYAPGGSARFGMHWTPERWVMQPEGYSMTVGTEGYTYFGGLRSVGMIDNPACSFAEMQKVLIPPVAVPPMCRFNTSGY